MILSHVESQLLAAGIPCASDRIDLLERYVALLREAGSRANLTGVRDVQSVWEHLVLRSARFHPVMQESRAGSRMIDVGSGAGIPGMILGILYPALHITMLEATGKKIAFVADAIERLGLSNATAAHGRAETFGHDPDYRASFDFAVARAVGSLAEVAELLLPFVRTGGLAIALKGSGIEDELEAAAHAAGALGADPAETALIGTPGAAPADTLVIWRKLAGTPAGYPRRAGMPHRSPLIKPAAGARSGPAQGRSASAAPERVAGG